MNELRGIVCNFLRHRLQEEGLEWGNCPVLPTEQNNICSALRTLADDFRSRYEDHFKIMFERTKFERHLISETAFLEIVTELFSEGIKWAYIVALFVLSGEFAVIFARRGRSDMLHNLVDWMNAYISNHLLVWIQEHGGWEFIVRHYKVKDQLSENSAWPRLRNWVFGAIIGFVSVKAFLAYKT